GVAWGCAGAAENPGKNVRFPVDHVRVAVATRRDQPDVFRDGSVRGARPLAIDNFMKIVWVLDIGGFQASSGTPRVCSTPVDSVHEGAKPCLALIRKGRMLRSWVNPEKAELSAL